MTQVKWQAGKTLEYFDAIYLRQGDKRRQWKVEVALNQTESLVRTFSNLAKASDYFRALERVANHSRRRKLSEIQRVLGI